MECLNYYIDSLYPKLIHKFNAILIKIQIKFFGDFTILF